MKTIAIYPGSFDPLTHGHLSLARRGLDVFDEIIIAIAHNSQKKSLFTVDERLEMIKDSLQGVLNSDKIIVDVFDGLLVDYAKKRKAKAILRGLRATADFEFEFQMALVNQQLNKDIQTVFLMTDYQWFYVSSTIVREIASLGGDFSSMVPHPVVDKLKMKMKTYKNRTKNEKN